MVKEVTYLEEYYIAYGKGNAAVVLRKDKVISVTDFGGPKGCETSRLPHFV
jgi:hypothetical protein